MNYDPMAGPDPDWWLTLDETERIDLVVEHHESSTEPHPELPNVYAHAAMHAAVENQLATDDPPGVAKALERLQREGLDRHDAIHAIAYVLVHQMQNTFQGREPFDASRYSSELAELTARKWQDMA